MIGAAVFAVGDFSPLQEVFLPLKAPISVIDHLGYSRQHNGNDHRAGTIDLNIENHAQVRLRVHRIVIPRFFMAKMRKVRQILYAQEFPCLGFQFREIVSESPRLQFANTFL
jgi:hypothetical protein